MAYVPISGQSDLLRRLVIGRSVEDHHLEFKAMDATGRPYNRNDDGKRECARDVAQFANAAGGTIVIGAGERNHVLDRFEAVPEPAGLLLWIDSVLNEQLEPVPPVEAHVVAVESNVSVLTLNIPPTAVLVARRNAKSYEFPIRAGDSKRYMTLIEIEARMQNTERLAKLRLEKIARHELVLLDATISGTSDTGWTVESVDDDVVSLAIGALKVDVPLAYVQAVYRTPEPGAAWVIALSAHIQYARGSGERDHLLVRRGKRL
jgi:hypothetical protein